MIFSGFRRWGLRRGRRGALIRDKLRGGGGGVIAALLSRRTRGTVESELQRGSSVLAKRPSEVLMRAPRPSRFGALIRRRPFWALAAAAFLALAAATVAVIGTGPTAQAQNERTPPADLVARLVRGGVELTWDRPAQNYESVDGYEILRRRPNRGEQTLTTLVSDTATTDTAYFDTTATEPGVRYNYQVKAIRDGVTSRPSNTATVLVLLSAPTTRLVSNVGQSQAGTASVSQQYGMGFRLGGHGQGYAITSVSVELAAVPSGLSMSLWVGGAEGHLDGSRAPMRELFEFDNPASLGVGLNTFAAPEGAFAYPYVNYFVVLSGFGSSLSVTETASDDEDPGGEPDAVLFDGARVRALGSTGQWDSSSLRGGALRMVVEGSRRDRGILASSFTVAQTGSQEIISASDDCCFEMTVGSADRYLIRGVAVAADSVGTTGHTAETDDMGVRIDIRSGFFGIPFDLQNSSGDTLFTLPVATARGDLTSGPARLTGPPGISEWSAPQGATVAGNATYVLHMTVDSIAGDTEGSTRGGIVTSRMHCAFAVANYTDSPSAPGVTLAAHGDLACDTPSMAVDGEPLVAMVSNLRQDNDSYATANSTNSVISQGFSTGPSAYGYRFQGIGVDVEGSDDSNSDPQIPDGPSSVSVAVHTEDTDSNGDPNGKPGAKLFDLVSPDQYAAGELAFFEAPPGTYLDPDTSYVMVWTKLNGEDHRLDRTSDDEQDDDPRSLKGFSLANAFYRGGSLSSLTVSSHALKIAVYGEAVDASFLAAPRLVSDVEVPDGPRLVSNVGQSPASTASVTQQYGMGFRLGSHGQGYEISGVSVELAAVPSGLSMSLWVGGAEGHLDGSRAPMRELFEFDNPASLGVGLNRFAAPEGAFAYPYVNYFVVLSGFGSSLSVMETASDDEDPGGEPDAVLFDGARVRALGSTGQWDSSSSRGGALRMVVEGSRRDRGILASSFTVAQTGDQEIISASDDCCFEMTVGSADRYLIRGVAVAADSVGTTGHTAETDDMGVRIDIRSGFFGIPFDLQTTSGTTLFTLPVATARGDLTSGPARLTGPPGISEWSAPQGATVAGNATYVLHMTVDSIAGDTEGSTRGGIVTSRMHCAFAVANYTDSPSAPGVTFSAHGDLACDTPSMAVDGEPLVAMVSNLRQDNDSYATANSTNSVISQGFSTGPSAYGYRFQGIGVDVEGSDDSNSDPQIPDGPSSVSVAVHAGEPGEPVDPVNDPNGPVHPDVPGAKLFDLVSPDNYAAGDISFFEAPAGTYLDPDTSYVVVWTKLSGEDHRLDRTLGDDEESLGFSGFSLADAFYRGGSLSGLSVSANSHVLKIAVYGEAVEGSFVGSARFVGGGHQVTPDWLHTPHDARVGDQFRVVFVTHHATGAMSGDIEEYNELVRFEASGRTKRDETQAPFTDPVIRSVASQFTAVVCTAAVDARTNTAMTDALGVPIRWLDGGWEDHPTLIAGTYPEFFGPKWQNDEWGAYVTGNSAHFEEHAMVWTGCDSTGTAHQMYFMGSPDGMVAAGSPNDPSANNAPIGAVDVSVGQLTGNHDEHRPLYAISPVFTIVPNR